MRLVLLPLFLVISACQVSKKPDLAWLYQPKEHATTAVPLILIHGSLGSKLRTTEDQKEVWPGNINDLIFSNYKTLANQINPVSLEVDDSIIESYAIFDSFSGLSIYDDIIQTLTEIGGYSLSELNSQTPAKQSLYVFNYDWRQDNVFQAQKLSQFINQVLANHPETKQVDVVAHSMGGLILRYFMRYGEQDVLPLFMQNSSKKAPFNSQADKIRHAILLGTPQLGSVKALQRLKSGFDFNLRNVPVEVQITMPSVFQLLPHPNSWWLSNVAGEEVDFNPYDPLLWEQQEWSIFDPIVQSRIIKNAPDENSGRQEIATLKAFFTKQLIRAKAFWMALSVPFDSAHGGFVIMGGSCHKTLNRLLIEQQDKKVILHEHPFGAISFKSKQAQNKLLFEPGDGQVSKSSLLGKITTSNHKEVETARIKYSVFVCEDHLKLTSNLTFQDNLLHVLLN